jgi:hypothetical protein
MPLTHPVSLGFVVDVLAAGAVLEDVVVVAGAPVLRLLVQPPAIAINVTSANRRSIVIAFASFPVVSLHRHPGMMITPAAAPESKEFCRAASELGGVER